MQIKLIPRVHDPKLKHRLEQLYSNCISFKGCTAFWTLKVDYFNERSMAKAMKKEGSFFCSDIQKPTNIDAILEYYDYGVTEIYLHAYRQGVQTEGHAWNKYLLHSKILLFELPNEEVEIWIGSHNQTHYAIGGLNLEASVAITCSIHDEIYHDTLAYLINIKNNYCFNFDANHVDIYKKLQSNDAHMDLDGMEISSVVSLIGEDMEHLEREQIIMLLALNHREYMIFNKVGDDIYIHTLDVNRQKETLYKCRVAQSGRLDKNIDKLEIDFESPRRFAYVGTHQLPWLKSSRKVQQESFHVSKYFVNLSISHIVTDFIVFEKPRSDGFSYWRTTEQHPYKRYTNQKIQKATFDPEIEKSQLIYRMITQ
jgi:hypothetical protein